MSAAPFRSQRSRLVERPQLAPYAPVISRAPEEVQVGVDPDAALVFRGAGFAALLGLSRWIATDHCSAARGPSGRTRLMRKFMVRWTRSHRQDCSSNEETQLYTRSTRSLTVRLIGAGPVGYQLARLLVASGSRPRSMSTTMGQPIWRSTRPPVCCVHDLRHFARRCRTWRP